jgi:hypothetical protein
MYTQFKKQMFEFLKLQELLVSTRSRYVHLFLLTFRKFKYNLLISAAIELFLNMYINIKYERSI